MERPILPPAPRGVNSLQIDVGSCVSLGSAMLRRSFSAGTRVAAALFLSGCAGHTGVTAVGPLSAPPPAAGSLRIHVVYPKEAQRVTTGDTLFIYASPTERIQSRDSAFIFGSVGRADARLTVNGAPIPVYATGAWLAWLPLPDDTLARFDLVATSGSETARA